MLRGIILNIYRAALYNKNLSEFGIVYNSKNRPVVIRHYDIGHTEAIQNYLDNLRVCHQIEVNSKCL